MKVRVQLVIDADEDGPETVDEVVQPECPALGSDTVGLQLAEAKAKELLGQMQEVVIEEQVRRDLAEQVSCPTAAKRLASGTGARSWCTPMPSAAPSDASELAA